MNVQRNDSLKHPSKGIPQGRPVPDELVNLRSGSLLQIDLEQVRLKLDLKVGLVNREHSRLIWQIRTLELACDSVRIYSYTLPRVFSH
jgi:hypothetical protein